MASNDRSRQQSGEAPQGTGAGQQGGFQQDQGQRGGLQPMTARGGQGGWSSVDRGMPAQRGGLDPSVYGGFGGGPFALMRRISDEMDRMFESFGFGGPATRGLPGGMAGGGEQGLRSLWSPHLEMFEREGRLVIQADLPGVRKEDVRVDIDDDRVVLQGERRQETRREEQGFFHTERSYGAFHRVIPLPEGVDADQAKASFRDGVLEIELPAPRQRQRGRSLTIEDRTSGSGGTSGAASGGTSSGSMSGEAPTG